MLDAITIYNRAVAEDDDYPVARQEIAVEIVVPKVVIGDKDECVSGQPEIDIHRQMVVVPKTYARLKNRSRREWYPPTIAVGLTPADPRGRPIIAWNPNPTLGIPEPSAIVKHDVSPAVV